MSAGWTATARRPARWLGPPVLLLAVAAVVFPAGGTDDSYITYWAARSLARSGEILNYDGERLEQSSSLLHTVLLALGTRLTGLGVPLVGYVFAPVAAAGAVAATVALARRVAPETAPVAGLLAATSAYLAFWTFGGLETTLYTALLAATVLCCARVAARAGRPDGRAVAVVAVVATVLVRPEGGFVLGAALAGAAVIEWWQERRGPRVAVAHGTGHRAAHRLAVLVGVDVVAVLAVMGGRLLYFGAPFPNPVGAKTTDLVASEGVAYLAGWWISRFHLPLLVVAVVGGVVVLRHRRDPAATLAATSLVAITGFVLLSGGDWMQGGRFLVPAVPYLAVLGAAALATVRRRAVLTAAAAALVAVQAAGVISLAEHRSTATPLWAEPTYEVADRVEDRFAWFELNNRVHRRNAVVALFADDVVERLLGAGVAPVTIAGTQAGLPVYHLFEAHGAELRFIDRFSLVTDAFTACEDLLEPSFRGLGRLMPYDRWFAAPATCGVPLPDVVIDFDTQDRHPGLDGRYTTVAVVASETNVATGPLPGVDATTAQFVAIRNDLLPAYERGSPGP